MRTEVAKPADSFVNTIGVNTHFHYMDTPYVDAFSTIQSLLVGSGIRHIRDGAIDTTWQPYYDRLNALGSAGVKADLVTSVNQSAAFISAYPSRVLSAIESFEGPNEYDHSGDPNWASTLASFQRTLYSAVQGRYPVIGPALTGEGQYAAVGDISAAATYGNMHDYLAGRNPGTTGWGGTNMFGTYATIRYNMAVAQQTTKTKPIFATETGYGEVGSYAVPGAVKAKYTLRSFLEHFNAGVRRTYVYEFLDEGGDYFGTYGLVTWDLVPKPSYFAVKTLIGRLSDKGAYFSPKSLTYGLTASSVVHHTLLQKRDGTFDLVLWQEAAGSNPDTAATYTVPQETATLNFASTPKVIGATMIGDDGNAAPVTLGGGGAAVTLPISDHVTIVNIHF